MGATALVHRLRIERYRGLKDFDWLPKAGMNVILGGGDVGKTTILDALALLFSPTNATTVSETDYCPRETEPEFLITATVSLPVAAGIENQKRMAYLRIVRWRKHQRICHPTKSYLPPPPSEALTGERAAPLDESRIREVSRKVLGRDRKIPRDQALEEGSDTFREIDDDFERKLAELAAGDLTPESIMEYLHLGLHKSMVANVHTAPPRYIDIAARIRGMLGSRGAPAGKQESRGPEEQSVSPAAFHGLPETHTDER